MEQQQLCPLRPSTLLPAPHLCTTIMRNNNCKQNDPEPDANTGRYEGGLQGRQPSTKMGNPALLPDQEKQAEASPGAARADAGRRAGTQVLLSAQELCFVWSRQSWCSQQGWWFLQAVPSQLCH